jgi:ribose-phosphate pyrophosphokinase
LEKRGAKRIFASCSHAILSDPAVQRINESCIEKLVITNTIPLPPEKHSDKFVTLSLADAIGDVIMRIQGRRSVSQLFR